MTPYYEDALVQLWHGDCLHVMPGLADASVDSMVTDPPYEIAFMGRHWDGTGIAYNVDMWRECLRVLKPGGHLLSFGGTRTFHRMAVAIEDAGFEIRDSIGYGSGVIAWAYGSGFPKSRAVSADPRFCQRVPDLCNPATEDATQSAAEVLLAEMRRDGEANAHDIKDLHGLPVHLYPDFEVPGSAEYNLLEDLREYPGQSGERGPSVAGRSASNGAVRDLRNSGPALAQQNGADREDLLLVSMPRGVEDGDVTGARLRRDGQAREASLWPGQPGMERRSDVRATEGQLHRTALRPMSTGTPDHGADGRLHHGTPPGDGVVGRPSTVTNGSGESHQPQPEGQPQGESGAISDERGSQTWRGWPVCVGCGKPRVPLGLGTALKPSWEPIVVARKPLVGTVAQNVQQHGTGALNIDGCRVATTEELKGSTVRDDLRGGRFGAGHRPNPGDIPDYGQHPAGRWPPNVVLDESQAQELDRQSGTLTSHGGVAPTRTGRSAWFSGDEGRAGDTVYSQDIGGASRFFKVFPTFRYEAKAPQSERPRVDGISHATVKPLELMRYLVRLVTPPGGLILEPFAGSGTTVEAALRENFRCIAIEREAAYLPLIMERINKPFDLAMEFPA